MSLSTTTLPLRGEPEIVASADEIISAYAKWGRATTLVASAHDNEAEAFDEFIATIGPAIDAGAVSSRGIVADFAATGVKVTFLLVDKKSGEVKRHDRFPNKDDIGIWHAVWHLMRDGDVTAVTARDIISGVNNVGFPTSKTVRDTIAQAVHDGKDVVTAVKKPFAAARNARNEAKAPAPFDGAKVTKRLGDATAELVTNRDSLTVEDKANIMANIVRLQSLVG